MDKKIAVYICTGCGIGEALDIEQLARLQHPDAKRRFAKTIRTFAAQKAHS